MKESNGQLSTRYWVFELNKKPQFMFTPTFRTFYLCWVSLDWFDVGRVRPRATPVNQETQVSYLWLTENTLCCIEGQSSSYQPF